MRYRYCPNCGQQLSAARRKADPQECHTCGARHYQNSKPCVGTLVVDKDRVLLVKRSIAPYRGWWDIPGGFLDPGEHPRDGAVREVQEETGLEVEPLGIVDLLIDTYGTRGDYTLNIYYLAKLKGGTPKAGDDAAQLGWFPIDGLPKRIAFANGRALLAAWRAGFTTELSMVLGDHQQTS